MEPQVLTHSHLNCFRACRRRCFIRFELGLVPEESGYALRVGSGFHAALEAKDKGLDPEAAIGERIQDPFDMALVAAMFDAHCRRYEGQELEVVATEQEFNLPLRNPETGFATPIWTLGGKMDRIVRLPDGRLALMEYKTTSRDFAPGAEYWLHLHMDQQLSIYVMAARQLGYPVETVLYDVTRRPLLRPLKATPEPQRKYTKDGRLYAQQRELDEAPEEFAARVAADIAARPDYHFARIEIARLDRDLEECAGELWDEQLAIREAQRNKRWFRSPDSCFNPYPCVYLPICQSDDLESSTPMGFKRLENVNPELSGNAELAG